MMSFFWVVVLVFVGLQAYIRFAPSDAANWTVDANADAPGTYPKGGGFKVVAKVDGDADALLGAFDTAMMAQPRTQKLGQAGGQQIYVTRSLLWGFPDYTTAALSGDRSRATFYSRLRFGKSDMGVNAKRLREILGTIGIAV
ncbi:DUF1499 domain-containing protein [Sulfitobacter sp. AS59]|uniref:DUF1499 domain-containing protein n=1 Tax=Sulfitobacter sp. AS59 TaxID=3135784 RepID=UPI003178D060